MSARLAGEVCRQTRSPCCAAVRAAIKVVARRVRYSAEDALVGGIEHRLAIRAFPFTRNEKLQTLDMLALWGLTPATAFNASSRTMHFWCSGHKRALSHDLGSAASPNSSSRVAESRVTHLWDQRHMEEHQNTTR